MSTSDKEWRAYQSLVAAAFTHVGMDARVEVPVLGARSTHRVDVVVALEAKNAARRWLAECKAQKRNVTKAAVLAFLGVLNDTGAERGFLVSEMPFQPSAISAAADSNIMLCTLQTLREHLLDIRLPYVLGSIERRAETVSKALDSLNGDATWASDQFSLFLRALNWWQWLHWRAGTDSIVGSKGLGRARAGEWPAVAGLMEPDSPARHGDAMLADAVDEFIDTSGMFLTAAEGWIDAAKHWLQLDAATPESRLLADRLRRPFAMAFPPRTPAGPWPGEIEAIRRLGAAAKVDLGYHATHAEPGINVISPSQSLFLVLDEEITVCLVAERWGPNQSQRLVVASSHGPVSLIDRCGVELGRTRRLVFLSDEAGVETAVRIECDNQRGPYAWIDRDDDVHYSLKSLPPGRGWRQSRRVPVAPD